jgi:hypothetical protein
LRMQDKYPEAFKTLEDYIEANNVNMVSAFLLKGSLHIKLQKMDEEIETAKQNGTFEQYMMENPI